MIQVVFFLILEAVALPSPATDLAQMAERRHYAHELAREFVAAGERFGVDPRLSTTLGRSESMFDPESVSRVGALDVMQLHPRSRWGREYLRFCRSGVSRMACTVRSVWIGTRTLRQGIDQCGSEVAAIGWYRTGRCISGPRSRRVVAQYRLLLERGGA